MSPGIFRFGEFELDRNFYELRHRDRPVQLERIPLDLLFLLVERQGQLVTREEILERIWGKRVFLDTDSAINSAVRKIRRALHDGPDEPPFVVTVPTRGYRFVAVIPGPTPQASQSLEANADDALSKRASIKYAKSGDVHIAYRIFGDGPRDIVFIPGTLSHLEIWWGSPAYQHLIKRLTGFARVVAFDKRGQGLSDRVVAEQTLEERIDDVRAVMDAAGSERATIYGWSEGGPMSLMFAATYPERATALVLYGTFASIKDKPWAASRKQWEGMLKEWEAHWGEGILLAANAPSLLNEESARQWCGRFERASASPGSVLALMRANYEMDVRHILPTISIPTLVMHRAGDALIPVAAGRYLAENIPGAKYTEIPGTDHTVLDIETQDFIANKVEEFITGTDDRAEPDRVLATVLYSYAVSSAGRAARAEGQRWPELLSTCYEVLRMELAAFRGREVKTTADGLLATFDGPARAIKYAYSAREKVRQLGLQLRTGLHTGECELTGSGVRGMAVDIAAKVASLSNPGEVLLSGTVKDLVAGSGLRFSARGKHALEGIPGEWLLFEALA